MRKLLPLVLGLIGLLAGGGAGLMLRPDPEAVLIDPCGPPEGQTDAGAEAGAAHAAGAGEDGGEGAATEFVKLNNQFIVPVVQEGVVGGLVILSISLEVGAGQTQPVYNLEPKLRDSLLRVLFDHANAGGFDGAFTNANTMDVLRAALLESAQTVLRDGVVDVLITDIVRQDS
jgi:hypothetical protein